MKNILYIPTSSLNFNSIFSSESISPHAFYANRCFGYKRNTQIAFQPLDNAILLFDRLFHFDLSNSNYEEYPIFIGVSEELIRSAIRKKFTINEIEISVVDSTIYFDTENFVFIFPSASIQQVIISKSLSSFETKTVSKYLKCFKTIDEYKEERMKISPPVVEFDSDYKTEIRNDESFDSLKGLFYCLMLGHFFCKPKHLLEIELTIKQIQNEFGGFKSDIELSGGKNEPSYSRDWKKSKSYSNEFSNQKYKSLLEKINVLIARIIETFGEKSKESLIKEFISNLTLDFELLKPFYLIQGLEDFVFKQAQQQIPVPEYLAKGLSDIVKSYYYNRSNSNQKEKLDNEFKDQINELNTVLQNIFQPNIDDQKLELLKTFAIQLDRFDFYNFFSTQKISDDDFKLYQIICEVLFKNRKRHKGETEIEIKNGILTKIGDAINIAFGKESKESDYLRNFYNLLNNRKHNFNIKNTEHNSLQAIVAFFINIDSAERLEEFIIEQKLKHRFLSLSFFGLWVGFAALGKTLTNKIFDSDNFTLLNLIDSVILKRNFINTHENEIAPTVDETQSGYTLDHSFKEKPLKDVTVKKSQELKTRQEETNSNNINDRDAQLELGL